MLFAKIPIARAQAAKAAFIAASVLDPTVAVMKEEAHIFFPVRDAIPGYEYEEREAPRKLLPRTLKEALADEIPAEELDSLVGSYDLVGSIAIVEVPLALEQYEDRIAAAVLESHPSVTTVLKKTGVHGGEYRTQQYTCIAGIDTRETKVVESGCTFLVDVEEVYYSVRLSTERLRLAQLMAPGERVLVLGAGAGPYTVVLAKHSVAGRVVGVEKNPVGHRYALENLRRNKLPASRAAAYEGDGQELSWLSEKELPFDRVIIPIPASPKPFELASLAVLAPKAAMHTYCFGAEHELPILQDELLARLAAVGWKGFVMRVVKAGQHKPYVYRWCIDLEVKKVA